MSIDTPKAFGTDAQDSYIESQDTYTSLFADQAKYNAIMHVLGSVIYREMRQLDSTQKLKGRSHCPTGNTQYFACRIAEEDAQRQLKPAVQNISFC